MIAIRGGVLLAIECKSEGGTVTEAQRHWLVEFATVRVTDAIVLRPADSFDDLARYLALWEGASS